MTSPSRHRARPCPPRARPRATEGPAARPLLAHSDMVAERRGAAADPAARRGRRPSRSQAAAPRCSIASNPRAGVDDRDRAALLRHRRAPAVSTSSRGKSIRLERDGLDFLNNSPLYCTATRGAFKRRDRSLRAGPRLRSIFQLSNSRGVLNFSPPPMRALLRASRPCSRYSILTDSITLGLSAARSRCACARQLLDADADPAPGDPDGPDRPRPSGHRPDRHRQDRGLRAAVARPARRHPRHPKRARCACWCWRRRASWPPRSPPARAPTAAS